VTEHKMSTPGDGNVELMSNALEAFNRESPDTCAALLAPDFIINLAGLPHQMRGREVWKHGFEIMRTGFPDIQAHIEDIFGAGDRVVARLVFRGTHSGEFQGIPATGREVEYTSIEIYRISDGLIAEEWICSDMATLMQQIGGTAQSSA
ncbi:MAG: ester cyclase, partial [Pyrinomonadaceae bacterium]